MAVLTAPQPEYVEVGQTIAAAAQAEAGYYAYQKPAKKNHRKAGNMPSLRLNPPWSNPARAIPTLWAVNTRC